MHRIEPVDFPRVRPLFNLPHLGFVMDAMIAGNSPAVIYVDDRANPRSAFVWDKTHTVYLVGAADNAEFNAKLAALIVNDWQPRVKNLGVIRIYDTGAGWSALAARFFAGMALTPCKRVLYVGDGDYNLDAWQKRMPPSITLHSIDPAFLTRPLAGMEETIEEIESCWTSMAQFYTDGFGFCLVTDTGAIVSRCTAEYVSVGKCGIGIETAEAHQNLGFATLTAWAFLSECQRRNLLPRWDSWADNTPSVAVAAKIGLKQVHEYAVQVAHFAES